MPRIIATLAAIATTASLIAVAHAAGTQIVSTNADGGPILLKRMVVTATALPPAS